MTNEHKNAGHHIQDTVDKLVEKGVPAKTAAYAASMGYLRALKHPGKKAGNPNQ